MAAVAGAVGSTLTSGGGRKGPSFRTPKVPSASGSISVNDEAELRQIEAAAEAAGPVVRTQGVYVEKERGKAGKITAKPWYIIDPRTSRYTTYWDIVTMVRAPRPADACTALAPRPALATPAGVRAPRPIGSPARRFSLPPARSPPPPHPYTPSHRTIGSVFRVGPFSPRVALHGRNYRAPRWLEALVGILGYRVLVRSRSWSG